MESTRRDRVRGLIDAAQRQAAHAGHPTGSSCSPEAMAGAWEAPPAIPAGCIPGYELLAELKRGGQGVVYEAIQHSTRRRVAVKVLREGPFAGASDWARFQREVQILAQLSHPNIVSIHDSGVAAGHAFVVMDRIDGHPLDDYVDASVNLSSNPRGTLLPLFVKICDAVNAAHLRGVIHRDLKPGNILIDAAGEPHVLDFGLAKHADTSDGERLDPSMTHTGQFVGSLPWSSPEQASGSGVDVRTDVYSLGVILYHCLTRRLPYPVHAPQAEVLSAIRTQEPVRPGSVARGIDGELETIVIKCLAKDPARRYQNAGDLARDLRHYLAGEPIDARRDSLAYVLRKQLHRHRLPVTVAAAFLLVLVGGLIASLSFWSQAVQQRDDARRERAHAEESQRLARSQQERAEREATKQLAVNQFLQDMLAKANRGEQFGNPDVTVREVVDVAAEELDCGLVTYPPEVEAAVRDTMALTYEALGLYDRMVVMAERSLSLRRDVYGEEHVDVARSLNTLGRSLELVGRYVQAEDTLRLALDMRTRLLGDSHADVASSLHELGVVRHRRGDYAEAESLLRRALALRKACLGEQHLDVANTLVYLTQVLRDEAEYVEAETVCHEALAMRQALLGVEHPDVAANMEGLAVVLSYQGRHDEALRLASEAVQMKRRLLGSEHPLVAIGIHNLAFIVRSQGDLGRAEQLYREALAILETTLGPAHPRVATTTDNLANMLQYRGEWEEAEALHRRALEVRRRALGDEHPLVANNLGNLARCVLARGDSAAAEALYREGLAIHRRVLGDAHPAVGNDLSGLTEALHARREDVALIQKELRAALELIRGLPRAPTGDHMAALARLSWYLEMRGFPPGSAELLREVYDDLATLGDTKLADALYFVARCTHAQGNAAGAELFYRRALSAYEVSRTARDAQLAVCRSWLGRCLSDLGYFAEAEPLLTPAYDVLKDFTGAEPDRRAETVEGLCRLYEAWNSSEPSDDRAAQTRRWQQVRDALQAPNSRGSDSPVQQVPVPRV